MENVFANDLELPQSILTPSDQDMLKALTAGDSANPGAMGTGGNTLQVESLELQLVSALEVGSSDFKLTAMQSRNAVGSTVHQYTQETGYGSEQGTFTSELGTPIESNSEFARITRNVKYMQTKREVSLQAITLNPTVGGSAEATEERLGTLAMLASAEFYTFHGNEAVSPNIFNGYPQQIRNEASQNVLNMGGIRLTDTNGEAIFEEAVRTVYEQGGEISDAFFPPVLAQDWQNLLKDRYRYDTNSNTAGQKLTTYQTMYGNDIMIAGRAGIDKQYKVKSIPVPFADATARPSAPTFALAAQATTGGTGFLAATAGTYRYTVYAIDQNGLISAKATEANLAVAAGEEAKITITRGAAVGGLYATGYIVCRGKKDVTTGTDVREMYKVAASGVADTVTLDQNDELPGTAEILMLSSNLPQPTYQMDTFLDLMRMDLGRVKASQPFLMVWYMTPDMKVAKRNALVKNVGHAGVDGWF